MTRPRFDPVLPFGRQPMYGAELARHRARYPIAVRCLWCADFTGDSLAVGRAHRDTLHARQVTENYRRLVAS